MRMGKHCYCEKPLTHSVWEARQMRETAAKHKVATQMGNHGTASDGLRRVIQPLPLMMPSTISRSLMTL